MTFMGARARCATAASALLLALTATVPASPAAAADAPCGTLAEPTSQQPVYQHVVVVMDENLSDAALRRSTQAPYLHSLAAACGSELLMHAATHPSQPNYMAATSGYPTALGTRSGHEDVFHQVQTAGLTWKAYEQSMTRACGPSVAPYRTGHNPPFWYDDLSTPVSTCTTQDVPLGPALDDDLANDTLPALSWITPDVCHDMHGDASCPEPSTQRVAAGDAWLAALLPRLTALPSYRAGGTLVLVTWDEGSGAATSGVDCTDPAVYGAQASCQVPTVVLSPYVRPGAVDRTDHDLYGLLGTVEDVLGLPRLGQAVGRPSLRAGLHF